MITGTLIHTFFFGKRVGEDAFGNRYYRGKCGKLHGKERRWVLYKDKTDCSRIPTQWRAWLHHTVEEPLSKAASPPLRKEHSTNQTEKVQAHQTVGGQRAPATGNYKAWRPNAD